MHRPIAALIAWLAISQAVAHEMTPTYPVFVPSHIQDVARAEMHLFNKRKDVEHYEVGVFSDDWSSIPFVSSFNIYKVAYLQHVKFDVYVRTEDLPKVEYICSRSKIRGDQSATTLVSSKICSRVK